MNRGTQKWEPRFFYVRFFESWDSKRSNHKAQIPQASYTGCAYKNHKEFRHSVSKQRYQFFESIDHWKPLVDKSEEMSYPRVTILRKEQATYLWRLRLGMRVEKDSKTALMSAL